MAYSTAANRATQRYKKNKNIVRLPIDVTADERDQIKHAAELRGMSVKQYVMTAIDEYEKGWTK